ncbi:hypothetical protein HMPREF9446_01521 [Bacteroides fluxus YIT 12057]|uniref:Uncharacterized protein n=1 Tax=Bacteroides fluxus YIT 12057 TaxID=763034 RepID=F3PS17_9BACE|nr:hypothetical protein HMPREF9446_01521 [Bacteroides fluxus YIT 12057]
MFWMVYAVPFYDFVYLRIVTRTRPVSGLMSKRSSNICRSWF